jgi:hypothetical protein
MEALEDLFSLSDERDAAGEGDIDWCAALLRRW